MSLWTPRRSKATQWELRKMCKTYTSLIFLQLTMIAWICAQHVRKRTWKMYSPMDDKQWKKYKLALSTLSLFSWRRHSVESASLYFSHCLSSIGEYIFHVLFLTCLLHQHLSAFSSRSQRNSVSMPLFSFFLFSKTFTSVETYQLIWEELNFMLSSSATVVMLELFPPPPQGLPLL